MKTVLALVTFSTLCWAQRGGNLSLATGGQQVIDVPEMTRVAVGDTSIADAKTIGRSQLLLEGVSEGKTTVLAWTAKGEHVSWLVTVDRPKSVEALSEGYEFRLQPGERVVLPSKAFLKVETSNPSIASAVLSNGQLAIRAIRGGHTPLIAWPIKGEPKKFSIHVEPKLELETVTLAAGSSIILQFDGLSTASSTSESVLVRVAGEAITLEAHAVGSASVAIKSAGAQKTFLVTVLK
jgi:hypothetical protein